MVQFKLPSHEDNFLIIFPFNALILISCWSYRYLIFRVITFKMGLLAKFGNPKSIAGVRGLLNMRITGDSLMYVLMVVGGGNLSCTFEDG